eukprot:8749957-Pyramimonas_sp.AAC.1
MNLASICKALRKLGFLPKIVGMLRSIYATRFYAVSAHAGNSSGRRLGAYIAQGCIARCGCYAASSTRDWVCGYTGRAVR